jgi:membrane peptidoglycan carboxypeptidase
MGLIIPTQQGGFNEQCLPEKKQGMLCSGGFDHEAFYKICLTAILIVFIVCLCGLLYAVTAWGNYDPDKLLPISNASRFYDMQSEAIESSILSRTTASVQIDELPPYVYQAFLAAEDQDFYQHFGINPSVLYRPDL